MKYQFLRSARIAASNYVACCTICFACALCVVGCLPCPNVADYITVHGTLLVADTLDPVVGAAIGGRSSTDGIETYSSPAIIFDGGPAGPVSEEDGAFLKEFNGTLGRCPEPGDPPQYSFPTPDQVELKFVYGTCESTVFIELNEETVVDLAFPDKVIQLRDPVLVPACDE